MCRVLLSINPEYVEKIFSGEKEFEFRKNRCKSDVNKMVIYCTSPVMKVIGEADIIEIIEDTPAAVWRKTKRRRCARMLGHRPQHGAQQPLPR